MHGGEGGGYTPLLYLVGLAGRSGSQGISPLQSLLAPHLADYPVVNRPEKFLVGCVSHTN